MEERVDISTSTRTRKRDHDPRLETKLRERETTSVTTLRNERIQGRNNGSALGQRKRTVERDRAKYTEKQDLKG